MHSPKLHTPISVLVIGIVIIILMLARNDLPSALSQVYTYPETSQTPTTTPTPTRTLSPTLTSTTLATSTATAFVPTATRLPSPTVAAPTPLSAQLEPTALIPECWPYSTFIVTGTAPAKTALLLFFDERAVGGGTSKADGSFALPMQLGEEQAGIHQITVRIRGPMTDVLQMQCVVPALATTPTPTTIP